MAKKKVVKGAGEEEVILKKTKPLTKKKKEKLKKESSDKSPEIDVKPSKTLSPKSLTKPSKPLTKKVGGLTLIITEKPQAAMKIAYALADITPVKKNIQGVPYYEVVHNDKKILVGCAVGHLYGLRQKEGQKGYPVFEIEWAPSYEKKGGEYTKKYVSVLKNLSKMATEFIVACDYDIEGELIGLNVLRFICEQEDGKRMRFSTLTKPDISKAYDEMMPTIDWPLARAGETRHHLDWLYGINLSRALMAAIKTTGRFKLMSIGRVQGPALALIVKKEKEIQAFKSTPYWDIFLEVSNSHKITVKYPKDITDKKEAESFEKLKGKKGKAETKKEKHSLQPPVPFDLTTLQLEAYKFHGISPSRTLQIAQKLYLAGLISYPRTSSQKLPPSIGYERILNRLASIFKAKITRKTPIEGSKSDPAHPAIYPTGEIAAKMGEEDNKIYELIARRFLACFSDDALIENKTITVIVDDKKFTSRGMAIEKKGWLDIYKTKLVEKELPDVNGEVKVDKVIVEEKETQPPRRYTEASLVSELAKRNLGTKSTRALIISTLYGRNYVQGKSIEATTLGISVVDTLEKYCPSIIDEKLTRHFEKEMDSIQQSKKSEQEEEKVIKEARKVLESITSEFKKKEGMIGKELLVAQDEVIKQEREASKVMICPVCKKGWISIRKSRFGKQFLGCSAYPECKTTFSLPPYGFVKKTEKICECCGWPVLMTLRKGKRPWEFCANPQCKKRLEQGKAKEEKEETKEEEETEDK